MAALTAELADQSENKVSVVCDHPLGLRDEPAKPDTVTPLTTSSPFPLRAHAVERAVFSPRATTFARQTKGFFQLRRRVPWSSPATRAQVITALVVETPSFFVKATSKGEASTRQKFTKMKLEELRRSRDCWRTGSVGAPEKRRKLRTEESRRLRARVQTEGGEWFLQHLLLQQQQKWKPAREGRLSKERIFISLSEARILRGAH